MNIFRVLNNLFRLNRTNWKVLALCLVAATVFWFFNALNKNYSTNVRFPLRLEFDQRKFAPAAALPNDIYVNVTGKGWDLLRRNLGFRLPIVRIPLERPVETRKIVGSTLPPLLAGQLGNLKINHIVTDTLFLSIEPRDSVKLKVVVDLKEISFRKDMGRTSPIVVLPDSVELQGPKSQIEALPDSILVSAGQKKLSTNYREQLEIPEGETIKRNPPVVEVIFEVGEVVTVNQKLKLDLINIPVATHVSLGSDSITSRIQIPKSRMDDFVQTVVKVKAVLNLSHLKNGSMKVVPALVGLPAYATSLGVDSVGMRLY